MKPPRLSGGSYPGCLLRGAAVCGSETGRNRWTSEGTPHDGVKSPLRGKFVIPCQVSSFMNVLVLIFCYINPSKQNDSDKMWKIKRLWCAGIVSPRSERAASA